MEQELGKLGEYIYLIQERESIRCNDNIFKIGMSEQRVPMKRLHHYPKGSKLWIMVIVDNASEAEKDLLKIFRSKYQNATNVGSEYFYGNPKDMINTIIEYQRNHLDLSLHYRNTVTHFNNINHGYLYNRNLTCTQIIETWLSDVIDVKSLEKDISNVSNKNTSADTNQKLPYIITGTNNNTNNDSYIEIKIKDVRTSFQTWSSNKEKIDMNYNLTIELEKLGFEQIITKGIKYIHMTCQSFLLLMKTIERENEIKSLLDKTCISEDILPLYEFYNRKNKENILDIINSVFVNLKNKCLTPNDKLSIITRSENGLNYYINEALQNVKKYLKVKVDKYLNQSINQSHIHDDIIADIRALNEKYNKNIILYNIILYKINDTNFDEIYTERNHNAIIEKSTNMNTSVNTPVNASVSTDTNNSVSGENINSTNNAKSNNKINDTNNNKNNLHRDDVIAKNKNVSSKLKVPTLQQYNTAIADYIKRRGLSIMCSAKIRTKYLGKNIFQVNSITLYNTSNTGKGPSSIELNINNAIKFFKNDVKLEIDDTKDKFKIELNTNNFNKFKTMVGVGNVVINNNYVFKVTSFKIISYKYRTYYNTEYYVDK